MPDSPTPSATSPDLRVVKRNGDTAPFEPERIQRALEAAFRAEHGVSAEAALPDELAGAVQEHTTAVTAWCRRQGQVKVERIQDEVERELALAGERALVGVTSGSPNETIAFASLLTNYNPLNPL
jgi:ribonucleoside-diphosphate reductase alpha chain